MRSFDEFNGFLFMFTLSVIESRSGEKEEILNRDRVTHP